MIRAWERILALGFLFGLVACTSVKPVDLTLVSQTNVKTVNTGLKGDHVLRPSKRYNIVAFYDGNERYEALAPYADSEGKPLVECGTYSVQLRRDPPRFGAPRYRVLSMTRLMPATNAVPAKGVASTPKKSPAPATAEATPRSKR